MQKTIDITTTQNVTIEYELASLRERAMAWLLDAAIVVVVYLVFFFVCLSLLKNLLDTDPFWIRAIFLMSFLFYFLYNILLEILNRGQTLGKKAMNIRVMRLDGKDPEWSDVTLRALLQLVDTLFSGGIIGALLIKTTGKSQRLGDMAANTTVLRVTNSGIQFRLDDILNIATLENYQPQYPQVRELTDRDMIFIKQVLSRQAQHPNEAHRAVVDALVTRMLTVLHIEQHPNNPTEFLRTLLRDYIVLTR